MIALLLAPLTDEEQIRYQKMGRYIALAGFIFIPIIWGVIKSNKKKND